MQKEKTTFNVEPSSNAESIQPYLRETHLGHYQEVSQQLRALPRREIHAVARFLVTLERENPLGGSMSPDTIRNLPVTRIVDALLQEYDENTASVLLEAGYTFRDEFSARAVYHLTQIAEVFDSKGDYSNLATAYLWTALIDSDRHDFETCLRHVWQALLCCYQVLKNVEKESVEWRKAVRCLAAAQHQFGIICRLSGDFEHALFYYHRSLALAHRVGDWRRVWASEGSIGNVFADQDYTNREVLHVLRSLVACLRGLDSPEMAPNALAHCYQSLGLTYDRADDCGTAFALYRKCYDFGIIRRDLLPNLCDVLCRLNRQSEAEKYFDELLAVAPVPGVRKQYLSSISKIQISLNLGKGREAKQLAEELIEWLLQNHLMLEVQDNLVRSLITEKLETIPVHEHARRAVLFFALSRHDDADKEIAAGKANTAAESKDFWHELEVKAEVSNEKKNAAASTGPAGIEGTCIACDRKISAGLNAENGLCAICDEARSLEEMVLIPAGVASMPDGSIVHVPAFYMDKTPITNRLFKLYHKAKQLSWQPEAWSHALRCLDNQPVGNVSRVDCEAFCQWRSRLSGRTFQLPTVEQWMRAALGDDGRIYPWGNDPPDRSRAAFSVCEDEYAVPPPVGIFPAGASPFGVLDMAGTVFEWTSSTKDDGQPFHLGGGCSCEEKYLNPRYLMSMNLTPASEDSRMYYDLGFRCVKNVENTSTAAPHGSVGGL